MADKIGLLPTFTADELTMARNWLQELLASDNLVAAGSFTGYYPFPGRIAIYLNGRLKILQHGEHWRTRPSDTNFYIGYASQPDEMPKLEKLAVIGTLIGLWGMWPDFHDLFMGHVAQALIGDYRSVMSELVQAEAPVSGLAFSADQRVVAGKIGEEFFLPNGTPVEIDDHWTVVLDRPELTAVS